MNLREVIIRKQKIVSFFSGCGGLDLGFVLAGAEIVWANDMDPSACETYRRNIGEHMVEGDVSEIDLDGLPRADGIIGGFPCQDFSKIGRRKGIEHGGKRASLYEYMVEAIKLTRPAFFLAENVMGLLSSNEGRDFERVCRDFSIGGYHLQVVRINFADYGVAQRRRRVLFIGTTFPWQMPFPTTPEPYWVTAEEALAHVDQVETNNEVIRPTSHELWLLPQIRAGECAVQAAKRVPGLVNSKWREGMYRRLDKDKPALTILGSHSYYYHWEEHRRLTIRETARLFGYPDNFRFMGSYTSQLAQLRNSVPPGGIRVVAESLLERRGCDLEALPLGRMLLRQRESSYEQA